MLSTFYYFSIKNEEKWNQPRGKEKGKNWAKPDWSLKHNKNISICKIKSQALRGKGK